MEPNQLVKCCGGAAAVYWNRELDDTAGFVIAVLVAHCLGCPCVHPGMLYQFDNSNGKMGDACGCCPVNKGHDPGCLCKTFYPPCAVIMNNPDNTTGALIACLLELTPICTSPATAGLCWCPMGCCYTLICWQPDTDGAKGNAGAPAQEEMA